MNYTSEYSVVDLEKWPRKQHFEFFNGMDQPFFNITAPLEVGELLSKSKQNNTSFYLSYLHLILKAVNEFEQFRIRVMEDNLVLFDRIDVGATMMLEDKTFRFVAIEYKEELSDFIEEANTKMEQTRMNPDFAPNNVPNMIYFSSIPWVSYTHISHAKNFDKSDYIPRLSVGKYYDENGVTKMPVSIEVHHALCDGYHVGMLFQDIQERFLKH